MKEIDVPDWEAEHLVSGGTAEYPTKPALNRGYDVLKAPDPDYESGLKFADGSDPEEDEPVFYEPVESSSPDFDSDFDSDDSDIDVVTPQVKRPSTVDNKAAWIEWAVANGANGNNAAAQTKAMLIAEYGKL
jgi:hypothetical protein